MRNQRDPRLLGAILDSSVTDNLYVVRRVEQDPSDDVFLAAALEGQADYIVTLDRHLLSLKQYHGVQIVRPASFLRYLRTQNSSPDH